MEAREWVRERERVFHPCHGAARWSRGARSARSSSRSSRLRNSPRCFERHRWVSRSLPDVQPEATLFKSWPSFAQSRAQWSPDTRRLRRDSNPWLRLKYSDFFLGLLVRYKFVKPVCNARRRRNVRRLQNKKSQKTLIFSEAFIFFFPSDLDLDLLLLKTKNRKRTKHRLGNNFGSSDIQKTIWKSATSVRPAVRR